MARKIHTRIKVIGTLVAQTPIHIGGMSSEPGVDLALAINGQGKYYIPGTSLAGALRDWTERYAANASKTELKQLWGHQKPHNIPQKSNGTASLIVIEDAVIVGDVIAEIREGVGIDRLSGTAAEGIKYNRAILPKGTKIEFKLSLDSKNSTQLTEHKNWLGMLLTALKQEQIRFGAAKTRGLGRVKLDDANLEVTEDGFSDREAILRTLKGSSKNINNSLTKSTVFRQIEITIEWQPIGPLMVKSEADGVWVDSVPLTSAANGNLTFVLPGSSIKGSLRSQAERIMRTLLGPSLTTTNTTKFVNQIENLPLVSLLFGQAAKRTPSNSNFQSQVNVRALGTLFVDDCYAEFNFPSQDWSDVISAGSSEALRGALDKIKPGTNGEQSNQKMQIQQAYHVAIDRWTGGAADGFLYSTLEPLGVEWEPIRLTLDLTRIQVSEVKPVIAFLLILLRDFKDGRIPLGYATNRGMGAVKISKVSIEGKGFTDKSLEILQNCEFDLLLQNKDFIQNIQEDWSQWLSNAKYEIELKQNLQLNQVEVANAVE